MVVDKATKLRRKEVDSNILNKPGARTVKQILTNGFAALLSTVLYVSTENKAFIIVYAVGVGATLADFLEVETRPTDETKRMLQSKKRFCSSELPIVWIYMDGRRSFFQ
jgi:uncharacterized membrane protein